MLARRRSFPALLAATLIATASPAAVEGEKPGSAAEETAADPASAPSSVHEDYLFVRESLPFLPGSNTITTKLPMSIEETPANVGVVDAVLIQQQNATVLGDALMNVSGLNVQTFNGVFDFFVVRGFDSVTSGLILTDGAPEPEATFYQLYNTERVEVFKGPTGFLYGSNPLAGTVNIVREQPVPENFGVVGGSLGSWDTHEAKVDLNRTNRDGTLSYRINGLWRESEGHRDGIGFEVGAINPAITWADGTGTSLNVNLELGTSDFAPDAGLPILGNSAADVPRERSYASPFDFSEQEIGRFQVDFEKPLGANLRLRDKVYYRGLDWRTNGTILSFVFPNFQGGLDVSRNLLLLDDDQKFWGNQLELLWSGDAAGVSHTLLAGIEYGRFGDDFTLDVAFLPSIDVFNPVETASGPLFLLPGQSQAGEARSVVVAPYVVDQIAVSDRLHITAGVRYDSIDFEDDARGLSQSEGEVSPMLGATYAAGSGLVLYANAARSFAPPSPRLVGSVREPEESEQIEIGFRRQFLGGRGRLTVAAFDLERLNIPIPDDNGFTQQVGDQRARGIELELGAELAGGLRGILSYAYTDSELTRFTEQVLVSLQPPTFATIDHSGNRSVFSPEHLANAWLSRTIGRLTVGGGLRYVDQQFIAEDNTTRLDDYLLLNAAISYRFSDWRLTLNLENLADEEYQTRGTGAFSVIPAAPFSATFGFEYGL